MRRLRWAGGILWIASWRIIYLEIFRWHHMSKTLRFTAPEPLPGHDEPPRPGLPVKAACVTAVTAPLVFLATFLPRPKRGQGAGSAPACSASRSSKPSSSPARRKAGGSGRPG